MEVTRDQASFGERVFNYTIRIRWPVIALWAFVIAAILLLNGCCYIPAHAAAEVKAKQEAARQAAQAKPDLKIDMTWPSLATQTTKKARPTQ